MTERAPLDCAVVLDQVHALLDGELDDREADELRHHLDACEHCFDEAELVAAVKRVVRRSCGRPQAPSGLRLRIASQITSVTWTRVEFRPE